MKHIRGKILLLALVAALAAVLVLPAAATAGWTWDRAPATPDATAPADGAADAEASGG